MSNSIFSPQKQTITFIFKQIKRKQLIFLFSATFPHYLAAGLQQPAMYGYGAAGAAVGAAGAAGAAPAATQGLQGRGT